MKKENDQIEMNFDEDKNKYKYVAHKDIGELLRKTSVSTKKTEDEDIKSPDQFLFVTNTLNLLSFLRWSFIPSIHAFKVEGREHHYRKDLLSLKEGFRIIFTEKPHESIFTFIQNNLKTNEKVFPIVIEFEEGFRSDSDIKRSRSDLSGDVFDSTFFIDTGYPISCHFIKRIIFREKLELEEFQFLLTPFDYLNHYGDLFTVDNSFFSGNSIEFSDLKSLIEKDQPTIGGLEFFDDLNIFEILNKFHGALSLSLRPFDSISFDSLEVFKGFLNTNLIKPEDFDDMGPGWQDVHLLDRVHRIQEFREFSDPTFDLNDTSEEQIDRLIFLIITRYLIKKNEENFIPLDAFNDIEKDLKKAFKNLKLNKLDSWLFETKQILSNESVIGFIDSENVLVTLEALKLFLIRPNIQEKDWLDWAKSKGADEEILTLSHIYGGLIFGNSIKSEFRIAEFEKLIIFMKNKIYPIFLFPDYLFGKNEPYNEIVTETDEDGNDIELPQVAQDEFEEEWRDDRTPPYPFVNGDEFSLEIDKENLQENLFLNKFSIYKRDHPEDSDFQFVTKRPDNKSILLKQSNVPDLTKVFSEIEEISFEKIDQEIKNILIKFCRRQKFNSCIKNVFIVSEKPEIKSLSGGGFSISIPEAIPKRIIDFSQFKNLVIKKDLDEKTKSFLMRVLFSLRFFVEK